MDFDYDDDLAYEYYREGLEDLDEYLDFTSLSEYQDTLELEKLWRE